MSLNWKSQYSIHRAQVGFITLSVIWEDSRDLAPEEKALFPYGYYTVRISGAGILDSKKKFNDVDEAKACVIALAKSWIAKMAAQLDETPAAASPNETPEPR